MTEDIDMPDIDEADLDECTDMLCVRHVFYECHHPAHPDLELAVVMHLSAEPPDGVPTPRCEITVPAGQRHRLTLLDLGADQ